MKETRFKETEIGQIPKDWEIYVLGDKAEIYRGGSPRPIEEYLTELPSGINWVKIGDVKPGDKYIRSTAEKIKPTGIPRSRNVEPGDLILSNSMSFGRPYILAIDGCIHDGWLVIKKYQPVYDKNYLYYVLGSSMIVGQYKSMAAGSSVQNLNKDKVAGLKVMTPRSIEEQSCIAAALTSVDDLITALDKLIEKKKSIKQGSMQLLLTGKKRLKGFSDPWQEIKLGAGLKFISGAPFHSSYFNTEHLGLRLIKNRDLKSDDQVCYYNGPFSEDYLVENGDLLIGMDGDFIPCLWEKGKALLNQRVGRIVTQAWNAKYLYYTLLAPLGEKQDGTGATTVKHLSHNDVENMQLFMSTNVDEQTAIASILTSMDEEISSLETKKAKYEQIKQGMMQQLLTGKIRLIEEPA